MGKRRELERQVRSVDEIPAALRWIEQMIRWGLQSGEDVWIRLGRLRRSLQQNALLWPLLTDLSKQVVWFDQRLKPEEWKDLATAGLNGQKMIPGIEGGIVALGVSTSSMSKRQFSDLIEYIYAFGTEKGVTWSWAAQHNYNEVTGVTHD